MKWISVEERLPRAGQDVLAAFPYPFGKSWRVEVCHRRYSFGQWEWSFGDEDVLEGVTHWMPLPRLPAKPTAGPISSGAS